MKNFFIINILNFFLLLIFLNFSPIDFECDAGLAYRYGKTFFDFITFNLSIPTFSYRPPVFSIYLVLTGLYIFESFFVLILFNSILSFIQINFLYYSFSKINKNISLIITILFQLTFLSMTNIKSGWEMHLMNFFIVMFFCSIILTYSIKDKKFIYLSFIFALLATFTRLDGIILIPIAFIFNFLIIFQNNNKLFKDLFYCFLIVFFTFFLWFFSVASFFYMNGHVNIERGKLNTFTKSLTSLSFNHQTGGQ